MDIIKNKDLIGFMIVIIGMFLTYTIILQKSNNLPYVFDNNETFSSIIHAKNLDRYGISKTYGLTDESYAITDRGHPYVYTHQGNFSRIYAFVLIKLGFESPESHIIINLITIGLLGLFLAYKFFNKHISLIFSVIYCLLLMSDYILYAQWHVNTWRIWHIVFFFSSLLVAEKVAESTEKKWLLIGLLNFACLFYYEILFSLFVLLMTAIYTLLSNYKTFRKVLRIWLIQFIGTAVGFITLAIQGISYLGLDGFKKDVELTFFSRNRAGNNQDYIESVIEFMDSNHIVFWHNFGSHESYNNIYGLFRETVLYNLQLYTPFFLMLCSIITIYLFAYYFSSENISENNNIRINKNIGINFRTLIAECYTVILAIGFILVIFSLFKDKTFMGVSPIDEAYSVMDKTQFGLTLLVAIPISYIVSIYVNHAYVTNTSNKQKYLAILFLFISALLIHLTGIFSHSYFNQIYSDVIKQTASIFIHRLYLLSIVIVLTIQLLANKNGINDVYRYELKNLFLYVLSGTVAYVITFKILSGYVLTGYVYRQTPLFIFVYMSFFALMFRHTVSIMHEQTEEIKQYYNQKIIVPVSVWVQKILMIFITIFIFIFTVAYWFNTQLYYLNILTPDNASVFQLLREKYKGKTFVVNTYAASVSVMTEQWAYFDQDYENNIIVDGKVKKPLLSDNKYMWFKDKNINAEYQQPEYFICLSPISMTSILSRSKNGPIEMHGGCSKKTIVKSALLKSNIVDNLVVDIDMTGKDAWAIVKLQYD